MKNLFVLALAVAGIMVSSMAQARCDYPDDVASDGTRCGGRSADSRPGGYNPPGGQ